MQKLIVQHVYANGLATDLSRNRNHGYLTSVEPTSPPDTPALRFAADDSKVLVPPSDSLSRFVGVIVQCRFRIDPAAAPRRLNLVEGHLSFAVFVDPDRSISATMLDSSGTWTGVTSSPDAVSAGSWHTASFRHDGISAMALLVDDMPLASSARVTGAIRPVGPHGLAIGHWPETSGAYTFRGDIAEVDVWTNDPALDASVLTGGCCVDWNELEPLFEKWRGKAGGETGINTYFHELVDAAMGVMAAIRGMHPNDLGSILGYERLAAIGILTRRSDFLTRAIAGLTDRSSGAPSVETAVAALQAVIDRSPLTQDELEKAANALCLDFLLEGIAAGMPQGELKK